MADDPYTDYDDTWDVRADQHWLELLTERYPLVETPDGGKIAGECPRCKHAVDVVIPVEPAPGFYGFEGDDDSVELVVLCNCEMPHEGREAGKRGCGIFGRLDVG